MTRSYIDATTLIGLGAVGELGRLTAFEGPLVVTPAVRAEVTTEPARTNLERFVARSDVGPSMPDVGESIHRANEVLGEDGRNGDVEAIAAVLFHTAADEPVAVVSDDRRLRTVARGLGARVTGTIGVVVRAVEEGMAPADGQALVDRLDDHGLHMTAELRARAESLIEAAANRP